MSKICANIDNSIQVYIPRQKSSQSFVTEMKCQVNSRTSHGVLISKEISYQSYKEICSWERKKVNLGHWGNYDLWKVKNNSMVHIPRKLEDYIHGQSSAVMPYDWEVFSKFFSMHSIEPNWLHCNYIFGYYNETLGGWTGCVGQVCGTEY